MHYKHTHDAFYVVMVRVNPNFAYNYDYYSTIGTL